MLIAHVDRDQTVTVDVGLEGSESYVGLAVVVRMGKRTGMGGLVARLPCDPTNRQVYHVCAIVGSQIHFQISLGNSYDCAEDFLQILYYCFVYISVVNFVNILKVILGGIYCMATRWCINVIIVWW